MHSYCTLSILFNLFRFQSLLLKSNNSLLSFIKQYNDATRQYVLPHRLTFGQYIGLFHHLNKLAREERYQLKYLQLERPYVIPIELLKQMEQLSSARAFLAHNQKTRSVDTP